MCGIAGIFNYVNPNQPVDQAELLRMREHMRARGPDGAGLYISPGQNLGLAHRRLAIIDLSANAAQPMASICNRYQIVFNGEIYNYRELRQELIGKGVVFKTHSDTEVLLALYAHAGTDMCRRLRGMYAFAIWDTLHHTLFLARDPFGIKPLYLHDSGETLRFASQVKALTAGGAIPPNIDPESEIDYWVWGHIPEPNTIIQGIKAFAPGTWQLRHQSGLIQSGQFDSVEEMLRGESTPTEKDEKDLRSLLKDSVSAHLESDVPVGLFLSSGIDSSVLCGLMSEQRSKLQTITLGFEQYRGTNNDETVLASSIAKHYGTQHQTVWLTQSDFLDGYDQFMLDMDQPSIDGLNTWLVSLAASRLGLKVAVSGLGGDELFGGYPSFEQVPRIRKLTQPFAYIPGLGRMLRQVSEPILRKVTSQKYAGLFEYGHSWQGAYCLRRSVQMPWEVPGAQETKYSHNKIPEFNNVKKTVSYLEMTQYMRNQLLRDSDWASMAHSIELRLPLVDSRLTRQVNSQHQSQLRPTKRGFTKLDLAACSESDFSKTFAERLKSGFSVPIRDWLLKGSDTGLMTDQKDHTRGLRVWQKIVASKSFLQ